MENENEEIDVEDFGSNLNLASQERKRKADAGSSCSDSDDHQPADDSTQDRRVKLDATRRGKRIMERNSRTAFERMGRIAQCQ